MYILNEYHANIRCRIKNETGLGRQATGGVIAKINGLIRVFV